MTDANGDSDEPLLLHCVGDGGFESYQSQSLWVKTWSESKKIWGIAGPSIFGRLAMFSLTVITQSFAGHLGNRNLASISIATTVIISVTFGFLLGMASALETLCGKAYGARKYHMLGIYLQRSWIVLFVSSIFMLPLFVFASPLLKLMGQSEALSGLTGEVAMWLIPMHLSFAFQFTLMRFLQCQFKTKVIAWVSGGALLFHVLLTWIFVERLRVGMAGTALTLDFSWWLSVFGLFVYSVFGWCPHTWNGFSKQALNGLWEFFKLSFASGVMLSVTLYGWASMIALGFFAATGVRVANEVGAESKEGAKFTTKVSMLNSSVVGALFSLSVMICPDRLAMLFTTSAPVIKMVGGLSFFLALTIFLNCIQSILSGVAVGYGWQARVAFVNLGSYYVVGMPVGIWLAWFFNYGVQGMWAGMIVGTMVQIVILVIITIKLEGKKGKECASL